MMCLVELPPIVELKRVVNIAEDTSDWYIYFSNGEMETIHKTEYFPSEYKSDYWNYKFECDQNKQ